MLKLNQGTLSCSHIKLLSVLGHLKNLKNLSQSAVQKQISACMNFFPFSVMAGNMENFVQ